MSERARAAGRVCFVGNLPGDVREREVEDLFSKVWALLLLSVTQVVLSNILAVELPCFLP